MLFLECERILDEVFKRDNSLRTQYALGVNAVRLGELYAHLAENSRAGRNAQLDLWRQARDSLQRGVASLQNVTANATLPSVDMVDVTEGVAILARVDAAFAKLGTRVRTRVRSVISGGQRLPVRESLRRGEAARG